MSDSAAAVEGAPLLARDAQGIEHFDVLIVGAGLSGIGAAYYLQAKCPSKRFAILEGRNTVGGTSDSAVDCRAAAREGYGAYRRRNVAPPSAG